MKNEGSPIKCFICGFILPSGADRGAPDRRTRRNTLSPASSEPFAAIGDRMLALILDRVVIVALLTIPAAMIGERLAATPIRAVVAASVAFVTLVLAYHITLEALFGATLGKGLLGLQVRNGSNERPWLTSSVRNVVRLVDSLVFYSLAFLVAIFTRRRQRIGDLVAGTTVIERHVATGERIALLFIFAALVAGSLWVAVTLCPACLKFTSH